MKTCRHVEQLAVNNYKIPSQLVQKHVRKERRSCIPQIVDSYLAQAELCHVGIVQNFSKADSDPSSSSSTYLYHVQDALRVLQRRHFTRRQRKQFSHLQPPRFCKMAHQLLGLQASSPNKPRSSYRSR